MLRILAQDSIGRVQAELGLFMSATERPSSQRASLVSIVPVGDDREEGEACDFLGATQGGIGPERWGITTAQLATVEETVPRTDTMHDVVAAFVKPRTAGTGTGYALLLNQEDPCRAAVMVSHAWQELYHEFYVALETAGVQGPFWVCAFAIYQNEDIDRVTISKQLGPDPLYGPFATVLRQADCMIAVVTSQVDIYARMWCILEMFVALDLKLEVQVAQFTEAVLTSGADPRQETTQEQTALPLFAWCETPVRSSAARCGDPALPINSDEASIRELIEGRVGYNAIDLAVEKARLRSVLNLMDASGTTKTVQTGLQGGRVRPATQRTPTPEEVALFRCRFLLKKQTALLHLLDHLPDGALPETLLNELEEFDDEMLHALEEPSMNKRVRIDFGRRLLSVRSYAQLCGQGGHARDTNPTSRSELASDAARTRMKESHWSEEALEREEEEIVRNKRISEMLHDLDKMLKPHLTPIKKVLQDLANTHLMNVKNFDRYLQALERSRISRIIHAEHIESLGEVAGQLKKSVKVAWKKARLEEDCFDSAICVFWGPLIERLESMGKQLDEARSSLQRERAIAELRRTVEGVRAYIPKGEPEDWLWIYDTEKAMWICEDSEELHRANATFSFNVKTLKTPPNRQTRPVWSDAAKNERIGVLTDRPTSVQFNARTTNRRPAHPKKLCGTSSCQEELAAVGVIFAVLALIGFFSYWYDTSP